MKLSVRGLTPEQKRIIHNICYFICDKLEIDRVRTRQIHVKILKLKDAEGQTWTFENVIYVEVDKDCLRWPSKFFEILTHELVHARQYINGDFHYVRNKEHWKGSLISAQHNLFENVINLPTREYKNLPWEKEAYRVSRLMLTKHARRFIIDWKKTVKRS